MSDFVSVNVDINEILNLDLILDDVLNELTPEQWEYVLDWALENTPKLKLDTLETMIEVLESNGYEVNEK